MNEEIHFITIEGKMVKNELGNDEPDFFKLYAVLIKN